MTHLNRGYRKLGRERSWSTTSWTDTEEDYLLAHWGNARARKGKIAAHLKRSVRACERRMLKLAGTSSELQDSYTLRGAELRSGFCRKSIKRAIFTLRIQARQKRGRSGWKISRRNFQRICAYLLDKSGART